MSEITKQSFIESLDALLRANPHARNKGDVFKEWCFNSFGMNAQISHIREQRQTTNRVSEQFRYDNPIVVFVIDNEVNRDTLVKYVLERFYKNLQTVAVIGASETSDGTNQFNYTFEKLLVFQKDAFSSWCKPFFKKVEDGKQLVQQVIQNGQGGADYSNYSGDISPVIYYGAPGTGKTWFVQTNIYSKFNELNRIFTTFHQSFSYEDFVEGLKPMLDEEGADVKYTIEQGVFYTACERAAILAGYKDFQECMDDTKEHRIKMFCDAIMANKTMLLCIDEINRGNVASIFGDLISLIEPSKRLGRDYEMLLTLPYSKQQFGVPANLFIVGTMNTADRSIQLLDTALRRRFCFKEVGPNYSALTFEISRNVLKAINARIRGLLNKDAQIGQSYFIGLNTNHQVLQAITDKIIPLLEEYFYNNVSKVRFVLNDKSKSNIKFYTEDTEAKKAMQSYPDFVDIDEDDIELYSIDNSIEEAIKSEDEDLCKKYLDLIIGE